MLSPVVDVAVAWSQGWPAVVAGGDNQWRNHHWSKLGRPPQVAGGKLNIDRCSPRLKINEIPRKFFFYEIDKGAREKKGGAAKENGPHNSGPVEHSSQNSERTRPNRSFTRFSIDQNSPITPNP